MEAWELEAREAIRDLVARYNANGDAGRMAPMLALFAEDAELELGDDRHRGRAAIRALFEAAAARTRAAPGRFVRHFTATHQIDVLDPGSARGRCYFLVLSDRGLDHWGRYLDEYRRVDGRWRFQRRRVEVDGRAPAAGSPI